MMEDLTVTYLHGDLDLYIIRARDLPNSDFFSKRLRRFVTSCGACKSRTAVSTADHHSDIRSKTKTNITTSDPYVAVRVPQATVARTRVVKNTRNPKWDQRFLIQLAHPVVDVEFHVKDDNTMGAELIGVAKIPATAIVTGDTISGWFPLMTGKSGTAIELEMKFTWVGSNPLYNNGIGGDPEKKGVRGSYFPLRKGSSITLYQDAHVGDNGVLPSDIQVEGGSGVYEHGKCWEDICYAISEAHHLIYIVGWSVYYKVKLIREPTRPLPRGGDLTLGELLKYKSEEGVRVLLLVWDDKTSHSNFFINTEGVMQTHDEETRNFFKHSSVNCVLAPRYGSSKLSYIKQQVVGTMFTHHQKCVLVDTQGPGNNRKISAFIGGIDLCDGRYDTPEHRLFRDLDTTFKDDFHNPTFLAGIKAPRQPWHDLHCKIEGPAAYDVLINFEQRWKKATKLREFSLFVKGKAHWHDDALIKIERISWILNPTTGFEELNNKTSRLKSGVNNHHHHHHLHHHHHITTVPKDNPILYVSDEDDPNNWHVQIFRSIDSGSLKGFPKKGESSNEKIKMESIATSQNLLYTKNVVVDRSIQTAYIQAIRSAQHFIYIENQYFIGSSYGWPSYKNAGADNLIPMELALKIASKIKDKERFAVYIVIPMWPEGDPKTGTVQEILYWQYQTMQMMYDIVALELRKQGIHNSHPQDYLNFYCLGKREEIPGTTDTLSNDNTSTSNNSKVSESYNYRRFMIYVHAKGMIVDDEYVLMGSANINQRSLAGTKDTEIAMGAYQPNHTWENKKRHPHGQVYGYRMSLWAEHLAAVKRVFEEPKSLECVREVNKIAESNWKNYSDDCFRTLQGHLLKYPVQVDKDGKVSSLPGSENFPDIGGKVIGAHSTAIPDILTT